MSAIWRQICYAASELVEVIPRAFVQRSARDAARMGSQLCVRPTVLMRNATANAVGQMADANT
jgi:hypothetical protein